MSDEWGPWITHDGRGCPDVEGLLIECKVERDQDMPETKPEDCEVAFSGAWLWALVPWPYRVVAYRVHKPRALQQLRELAENPPAEKVGETV